jgi:DUF438 domain-containing protein
MTEATGNRAGRVRKLKHIITRLHQGAAPNEVKAELRAIVREADATEIAQMEEELIAEGMTVDEVRSMCDLHAQVLREIMSEPQTSKSPPGHPVDTFRRENEALSAAINAARAAIAEIDKLSNDANVDEALIVRLRQAYNDLTDVDKHYQRKEHLLFSCLERHGVTGPPKVMWAKDDEARELLKALGAALAAPHTTAAEWKRVAAEHAAPALNAVAEMVFKEENVLFPMALETLTENEWAEIWSQSAEYGWCLVEPREGYAPPAGAPPRKAAEVGEAPAKEAIIFPTGKLDFNQLRALFNVLPVDLTFVDADDTVAWFSAGPERIFARSKAVIGRKVQHCHPPKSVHVVEQILSDFRAGRQDVAEFWIEFKGMFVHIRYFAVRDEQGAYLGTLEVTQDVTHIRALEGERRLLQYDSPQ